MNTLSNIWIKKAKLQQQGYTIKTFEPSDTLPLFDFMREDFPYWLPNLRDAAINCGNNETIIVAKNSGGKVVGFAMRALDGSEERFGPFGVKPSLQGIGLGSIIFNEMMQTMCSRRIFHAYFLWTGGRNLDIYTAWGMKIYRSYSLMSKTF